MVVIKILSTSRDPSFEILSQLTIKLLLLFILYLVLTVSTLIYKHYFNENYYLNKLSKQAQKMSSLLLENVYIFPADFVKFLKNSYLKFKI